MKVSCCLLMSSLFQATGQKVLFINPGFTKRIIGLKKDESDALLDLLFKVCR